jgi:hypothetical protein
MIHAVGYDPEKHVLEVVFNTGRTYQHGDVPPELYRIAVCGILLVGRSLSKEGMSKE